MILQFSKKKPFTILQILNKVSCKITLTKCECFDENQAKPGFCACQPCVLENIMNYLNLYDMQPYVIVQEFVLVNPQRPNQNSSVQLGGLNFFAIE